MMLVLYDDNGIEAFDSPDRPPPGIETIDVENEEYDFCDDQGQRYAGKIIKGKGFFTPDDYELIPVGTPDKAILEDILRRAVYLQNKNHFATLEELKKNLTMPSSESSETLDR